MAGSVRSLEEMLEPALPHPEQDLLHLLTCPACRNWKIGRLLEELTPPAANGAPEETYAGLWERLEERAPELEREARQRRQEAEEVLRTLLASSAGKRRKKIQQTRFHNLDLLDLLLEESQARQLDAPGEAVELADLAAGLAGALARERDEAADSVARAWSLGANACRLRHDARGAEERLAKAAPFLVSPLERAFYCRTAALARWEQGRTDEAAALLHHAARLYGPEGPFGEEAACLALLGLLLCEEDQPVQALPPLWQGWAGLDRDARPALTVRTGLALVSCLTLARQDPQALAVFSETFRLAREVHDEAEGVRLYWHNGRTAAVLGRREDAILLLEPVRRKLFEERSAAEAALVSLDLALVLAEEGRAREIAPLREELETSFGRQRPLDLAAAALSDVAAMAERKEPGLRRTAGILTAVLTRSFRTSSLRIHPFPFA